MKRPLQSALIGLTLTAAITQIGCGSSEFASGGSKARVRTAADSKKETLPQTQPDGATTEVSGQRVVQTFIAEASRPVDIVMALDTSTSMVQEKAALEKNINVFIDEMGKSHLDAKITLLAKTSNVTDAFNYGMTVNFPTTDRFRIIDQYIHSNDAISHLSNYFAGKYGFPFPLRDNAVVEVIIMSDDDGSNAANQPYSKTGNLASEFKGPTGKDFAVNAVVGMKQGMDPNNADCEIANRGEQHIQLSQQTKGSQIDLCEKDWSVLLKKLSETIASRRATYSLSHVPDINLEVVVTVDGIAVDPTSYTIDAKTKTLRFAPEYPLKTGAQVRVEYYYTK